MSNITQNIAAPSGWSVLEHVNKPHAAFVTRDPLDHLLKGVRYQITTSKHSNDEHRAIYTFSIEGWCYRARGAIKHQTLLSFNLLERLYPDPRVSGYVSNIRIFNRPFAIDEMKSIGILRYTAEAISNIDNGTYFDWINSLSRYGLINEQDMDRAVFYHDHVVPEMSQQRLRDDALF